MTNDNRIFRPEQMSENDKKIFNEALDSFYDKHYGDGLTERLEAERKADPDIIEVDGKRYNKKYMNKLKRLRAEAGYSQSKLAELSGVSVRMIQNYEQGANDINMAQAETVYKLAQALGCNMEELLEV